MAALKDAESVFAQDSILVEQRHEVGDRAHGNQVEIVLEDDFGGGHVIFFAQGFEQAVNQFEDQPNRAEVCPWLARFIHHVRVDQDAVGGRVFLGAVVVDDNDINALASQVGDLLNGIGSAIDGDKQVD